ncbi:acyltransferase family protein [Pseudomonas japonica]|uniref:Peptidoglycan/LPS O-acetylase OafA/YrhL, contains acyltransferase and SGNH-hydrolase domains n=1 Tax=Pseudomonas japonica TaxID=256466 RepID=A0A239AU36_9PSED|nr:acyltransferase [Pseudomonas japonica]SNR98488.1 Peptidoglycan/LPS O-acetylase OafA/YrhL, contains acyltransferase and SGNH-hydrolase domains [Pseudomonas japonica]
MLTAQLLAVTAYLLALATAALLLHIPAVARNLKVAAGRSTAIDGLRGYLALGVFIHHSAIAWHFHQSGQIGMPPERVFAQIGQIGVALFFMITGFLFWDRLLKQARGFDWQAFAISRIFRLYPLYLPLLAAITATAFFLKDWVLLDAPAELLKHLSLWLIFERPDINQLDGTGTLISNVTWTLAYEVYFYLALPLLGMIFIYRGTHVKTIACLVGLYLLAQVVGFEHSLKKKYLLSFVGGIAAAYWIRRPTLVAWGRSRIAAILAVAMLLVVMTMLRKTFAVFPLLLLSVFFFVVVSGNELFGALRLRSARWLGEISYSTYLLHGFLLWWVVYYIYPRMGLALDEPLPFLGLIALCCVLLVLISSLTFLLFEKPGIAKGKQLAQKLRRRREARQPTKAEKA